MGKQSNLYQLYKALMHIRTDVDPDMPIQQLLIFLEVCLQEGITMTELGEHLDMPSGTVSRNVKVMSKYVVDNGHKKEIKGADLFVLQRDLEERRRLGAYLTTKGKRVETELLKILDD